VGLWTCSWLNRLEGRVSYNGELVFFYSLTRHFLTVLLLGCSPVRCSRSQRRFRRTLRLSPKRWMILPYVRRSDYSSMGPKRSRLSIGPMLVGFISSTSHGQLMNTRYSGREHQPTNCNTSFKRSAPPRPCSNVPRITGWKGPSRIHGVS
jgi:hypothetical protein